MQSLAFPSHVIFALRCFPMRRLLWVLSFLASLPTFLPILVAQEMRADENDVVGERRGFDNAARIEAPELGTGGGVQRVLVSIEGAGIGDAISSSRFPWLPVSRVPCVLRPYSASIHRLRKNRWPDEWF